LQDVDISEVYKVIYSVWWQLSFILQILAPSGIK
jgi:hypothetical protein